MVYCIIDIEEMHEGKKVVELSAKKLEWKDNSGFKPNC